MQFAPLKYINIGKRFTHNDPIVMYSTEYMHVQLKWPIQSCSAEHFSQRNNYIHLT